MLERNGVSLPCNPVAKPLTRTAWEPQPVGATKGEGEGQQGL